MQRGKMIKGMLILIGFIMLLGGINTVYVSQGAATSLAVQDVKKANIWLVKTDIRGNMEWNLIKDFSSDDYARADYARSVIQTSDGGFMLAGYMDRGGGGGIDAWLVKTDAHGVWQWEQVWVTRDVNLSFSAGIQTADGGFLLSGTSQEWISERNPPHGWLVKTDAAGNEQWSKLELEMGQMGLNGGRINDISPTADGGFVLVGQHLTFVHTGEPWQWWSGYDIIDGWLVKLNGNGGVEWEQTYDGGADDDMVRSVAQTADGGFLLAGFTGGYAWLVKTEASGVYQWDRTYGSGWFNSIIRTTDGGFLLSGSKGGGWGAWLVKTDASGKVEWQQTYGDGGVAKSVIETADGGFVFTGYQGVLVKTYANGIEEWRRIYSSDIDDFCSSVIQTMDGGYALAGFTFMSADTTPPAVILTSPQNTTYIITNIIPVYATNTTEPVYRAWWRYWNGSWSANQTLIWDEAKEQWEAEELTWQDGNYQVQVFVNDRVGNTAVAFEWFKVLHGHTTPPAVSSPADIAYEEGMTGYVIAWAVGDRHPGTYTIYTNSGQVDAGSWTNGTITWEVESLTPDTYNITLVVRDAAGNSVSDTVWVTVTTPVPDVMTLETPPLPELPVISTPVLLSLVALATFGIRRKRLRHRNKLVEGQ